VKRTISARADGALGVGRKAALEGVFLIKNCTSAVPHNITLFVKFEYFCSRKHLWLVY